MSTTPTQHEAERLALDAISLANENELIHLRSWSAIGQLLRLMADALLPIPTLETENADLKARVAKLEAQRVPKSAIKLVGEIIFDMENGFVRCSTCGDQEDTKDLDFMWQLYRLRDMLGITQAKDEGCLSGE